jgi:predicted DNA-binding transcriptional regulator AlpA
VTETADLLTPKQLRQRLGMSASTFYRHHRRGAFKHLLVKRPLGHRRFSKALVDDFVNGDSTVALGRRAS